MPTVKIHKNKLPEKVIAELYEGSGFFDELYVIGLQGGDIHWWSAGSSSLIRAVGSLEYLKNSLLEKEITNCPNLY
jgi:hypothetical protein